MCELTLLLCAMGPYLCIYELFFPADFPSVPSFLRALRVLRGSFLRHTSRRTQASPPNASSALRVFTRVWRPKLRESRATVLVFFCVGTSYNGGTYHVLFFSEPFL